MIQDLLDKLASVRYGRDMRQTIIDAIRQCYEDATGNPDSISAAVNKVSELSTKLTNLTTRVSALQSDNDTHKTFEEETDTELTAIKTDIENLKKTAETKEVTIEAEFTAGTYGKKGVYVSKNSGRTYVDFSVVMTEAFIGESMLVATIPSGYRPIATEYRIVPTTGGRIARMSLDSSGQLKVNWIKILSSGESDTTTAGLWFQGSFDY